MDPTWLTLVAVFLAFRLGLAVGRGLEKRSRP
jgi:hypothetical protein